MQGNLNQVFNDLLPTFVSSDFLIGNMETVLISKGTTIEKDGSSLKTNPKIVLVIRKAGFNVLCLANNHINDFGEDGIKSTIDTLDNSEIKHVGVGKDSEHASNFLILEKDGL